MNDVFLLLSLVDSSCDVLHTKVCGKPFNFRAPSVFPHNRGNILTR